MSDAYRDERESLEAKIQHLEEAVAEKDRELVELRRRVSQENAVLSRLESALDRQAGQSPPPRRHRVVLAAGLGAALVGALGAFLLVSRPKPTPGAYATTAAELPAAQTQAATTSAPKELCARPGVRLTVDGSDAEALAQDEHDLAGHKYRRGGSRSPWFGVHGGNVYVHGVGDFMPADVGQTSLTLLTIKTKGEADGYRLARGGRSFLDVMGADGTHVWGRFEADASKVSDTTREPPFGTPVIRIRGSFCLRQLPANPSDTAP